MATKRLIRRQACTGKIAYKTKALATSALQSLIRSGKTRGFVNVYPCPFGSHFHVGHRPKHP